MVLPSKKSIISIGHKSVKITCGVYCSNDVRFIILTGQSIVLKTQMTNKPLVHLSDLNQEIENLAQLFFDYDTFVDIYNSFETFEKTPLNLNLPTLNTAGISKKYIQIKEKSLVSNWK